MARRGAAFARVAPPLLAALLLAACATTPHKPPPGPFPAPEPAPSPAPTPGPAPGPVPAPLVALSTLPGWAEEDHAAALAAFRATCHVAKDPALAELCQRARAEGPQNEAQARAFLELNFRAQRVGGTQGQGLLTAYFAPRYEGRISRQGEFTAAVRPKPADLDPKAVLTTPYADRATIESKPEPKPLAWMRPEDLFFMQIQGSGVLTLPGGIRKKALYAANNGQPFHGIAIPMRDRGLLPGNNTSGEAIHQWLADHRGPDADEIMQLNTRYAFFRMADDDGAEPLGAAGLPMPVGHGIAVDHDYHPFGALYWLDADAPTLNGAAPRYRRLVVSLDTGGAIKGEVRADLYLGTGDAAGLEAGRVKHTLVLYHLVPVGE
ncbi:MAG: transglycosylase [Caulobacter sp.]|nr:transglycosylase [Caulobacter sp.]